MKNAYFIEIHKKKNKKRESLFNPKNLRMDPQKIDIEKNDVDIELEKRKLEEILNEVRSIKKDSQEVTGIRL